MTLYVVANAPGTAEAPGGAVLTRSSFRGGAQLRRSNALLLQAHVSELVRTLYTRGGGGYNGCVLRRTCLGARGKLMPLSQRGSVGWWGVCLTGLAGAAVGP